MGWAFLATFQAGDALFCTVVINPETIPPGSGLHRTNLVAGPAVDAIRFAFGKDSGKSVEHRQARSQRADHLAKESTMTHRQDDHSRKYGESDRQRGHVRGLSHDRPRNCRFDGPYGTESAKIEREFSGQEYGHTYDKTGKEAVLDESRPPGKVEFHVRDLVQEFLNQSKGASPSAEESPREQSSQGQKAYDTQGDDAGSRALSDYPQGTRKDRNRARMAIQHWKTYRMPLDQPDIK